MDTRRGRACPCPDRAQRDEFIAFGNSGRDKPCPYVLNASYGLKERDEFIAFGNSGRDKPCPYVLNATCGLKIILE